MLFPIFCQKIDILSFFYYNTKYLKIMETEPISALIE